MIYGCLQPRELWFIDFNHVPFTKSSSLRLLTFRMGTLKPGDVILAINGQSLEHCNLREAAHALRNAGDVVTLTVSKGCECTHHHCSVVYTHEL